MTILFVSALVLVLSVVLLINLMGDFEILFVTTGMGSAFVLFGGLAFLPFERMATHSFILELETMQTTATENRNVMDQFEGAAFRTDVVVANRKLRSLQYYNSTVFDIWIPDEIMKVAPIK